MLTARQWTGDKAVLEVLAQPVATVAAGVGVVLAAWLALHTARKNREQSENQFVRQMDRQAQQFTAQLEEHARNLSRQLDNETARADRDRRAERSNQRLQYYEHTYAEFLHSANQSLQGLNRSPTVGTLSESESDELRKQFQPYGDELTRLAGYFKIGEDREVENRATDLVRRFATFYDVVNSMPGSPEERVRSGILWVGAARQQLEDAMRAHLISFEID